MHPENLFGPITQIGYLTDDIETTAAFWTQTSGIGPWTRMSGVSMATTMDGEPSTINIDVAITYKDDVQIELINPLCDSPSPFLANKRAGLWGLHHMQFTTKDMNASMELAKSAGLELACTINQGGGVYTYLRGRGVWFEMIQASEELEMFFGMIKSACDNWDGRELIRDIAL